MIAFIMSCDMYDHSVVQTVRVSLDESTLAIFILDSQC